jgi:hypothetical protein
LGANYTTRAKDGQGQSNRPAGVSCSLCFDPVKNIFAPVTAWRNFASNRQDEHLPQSTLRTQRFLFFLSDLCVLGGKILLCLLRICPLKDLSRPRAERWNAPLIQVSTIGGARQVSSN